MRYLFLLILSSLILAACSSSKEIETASLNQAPCSSEEAITDPNTFTGETAENLQVYQQGDLVFATVDVKTYCKARLTFTVEKKEGQLKLKLNRATSGYDTKCACVTNVTTSLRNIEPGSYNVLVLNSAGNQILAEATFNVAK